jgi:hypothetical protein
LRRITRIERNISTARFQHTEHPNNKRRRAVRDDRNRLSDPKAVIEQPACDSLRALVEFTVAQALLAIDHRQRIRLSLCMACDAHMHRLAGEDCFPATACCCHACSLFRIEQIERCQGLGRIRKQRGGERFNDPLILRGHSLNAGCIEQITRVGQVSTYSTFPRFAQIERERHLHMRFFKLITRCSKTGQTLECRIVIGEIVERCLEERQTLRVARRV